MARVMFQSDITDSDLFLDMPTSTQNLYFHLLGKADHDGFVDKLKTVLRNVKASNDDYLILISKKFIIPFESGVVVIRHWRMHNLMRYDRYKATIYQNEKALLDIEENKAYILKEIDYNLFQNEPQKIGWQPNGNQMTTTGCPKEKKRKENERKDSKDIVPSDASLDTSPTVKDNGKSIPPTLEQVKTYCDERKNNVNPQKFIDFYTSNGWKVGKNSMKNWQAAVRTWENSAKGDSNNVIESGTKEAYIPRRDRGST